MLFLVTKSVLPVSDVLSFIAQLYSVLCSDVIGIKLVRVSYYRYEELIVFLYFCINLQNVDDQGNAFSVCLYLACLWH